MKVNRIMMEYANYGLPTIEKKLNENPSHNPLYNDLRNDENNVDNDEDPDDNEMY